MKEKASPKTGRRPSKRAKPAKLDQRWHEAIIADYARLRHWPGVEYLGIGFKEVKGKLTRRRCVLIYVREKGNFAEMHRLPAKAKVLLPVGKGMYASRWLPTDVITHGAAQFAADTVRPGDDVSGNGESATLGCLVKVAGDNNVYCLTAGHTFVTPPGAVPPGIEVSQPALANPARLGVTTTDPQGIAGNMEVGYVDFALVTHDDRGIDPNTAVDPAFTFSKRILTEAEISSGPITAEKLGAPAPIGSGRTTGQVRGTLHDIPVGGMNCSQVLEITNPGGAMGQKGDSGALVVSRSGSTAGAVIGILFGISADGASIYVFPLARIQPKVTMA